MRKVAYNKHTIDGLLEGVQLLLRFIHKYTLRLASIPLSRWSAFLGLIAVFLSLSGLTISAQDSLIPLPPLPSEPLVTLDQSQNSGAFTIEYPSAARPARITRKFIPPDKTNSHEGINLYAPAGTNIKSGSGGKIKKVVTSNDALNYGVYVVIATNHNGITYRVTYAGLQNITVIAGQYVGLGVVIGQSAGNNNGAVKVVVQTPKGGMSGFKLPNVADPRPLIKLPQLRLRPTVNNLRLRSAPNLEAEIVGFVHTWSLLYTPETHYTALSKVEKQNQWLRVTRNSETYFVAAWYLEAVSRRDPDAKRPKIPLAGINLDINHPLGIPNPLPLKNLGWVRMTYNLSYNPSNGTHGNTDIAATYNRYRPVLKQYADNGNKIVLVLTHQFYGEGAGYVWEQMNTAQWQTLTARYADLARQVAAQYAGQNIVYAYQIWNEQDTLPGNGRAAVPIPAGDYAYLLSQTISAIRSVDGKAKIITGGHISGNALGVNYAKATLNAMPASIRPDGIAFHPYGVGPKGSPFNLFGIIDDAVRAWSLVMPGAPLWITEWGVLDHQGNDAIAGQVSEHATAFLNTLNNAEFKGAVTGALWYAWADSMDNGYGLVNAANQPKEPLYSSFLNYNQQPSNAPQFTDAAYG